MTGRDFLAVASQLAAGRTEAEWRSSISRAYYAAFHVARTAGGSAVCRASCRSGHVYLSRRLANCGQERTQQSGAGLNALRGVRNQADYDLHRPVTSQLAILHVRIAEQIVQSFQDALQEQVRTQVTDAMRIYERDVLKEQTWQP